MGESWLDRHLVPLPTTVPDFEVRRLRAISRATEVAETRTHHAPAPDSWMYGYELTLVTPDKKATGRVDAVVKGDGGPIIRDYKSGALYEEDSSTLKPSHRVQLMLYAAIYERMTGHWPVRLEILDLTGQAHLVDFTPEECDSLLARALDLLESTRTTIASNTDLDTILRRLASPSARTCRFCPFRPCCPAYQEALPSPPSEDWPTDTWGRVADIRTLGSGKILLNLKTNDDEFTIRGITPGSHRHPGLTQVKVGTRVAVFGLRTGGSPRSFAEGSYTIIYVIDG